MDVSTVAGFGTTILLFAMNNSIKVKLFFSPDLFIYVIQFN